MRRFDVTSAEPWHALDGQPVWSGGHVMSDLDTITLLNRLIVTSKNGEAALRAAASEAHHDELKRSLMEYSLFFHDAAQEMQDTVKQLGGHPKGIGTFGNTVHRW